MEELIENKKKLIYFLKENKSRKLRKRIHFMSLINITNILIDEKNKKRPNELIILINEYYFLILGKKKELTKLESLKNFNAFIYPAGKYMAHNYNFKDSFVLWRFIILGLLFDIFFILYMESTFFGLLPIFTLFFFIIGYLSRKKAQKNNRYYAYRW